MATLLPLQAPPVGAEQLHRALLDGTRQKPDLNELRDGVDAYVNYLLGHNASVTEALISVKLLVQEFNGRSGTHFAELAAQIVTWSIDEYYRAQGK